MKKRLFFFLLAFATFLTASAQDTPPADTIAHTGTGLRISLLTVAPGYDEVYEVFGHTGIRIVDSAAAGTIGADLVFNYGMFDGYEKNYEIKFLRGKLLYYVGVNLYSDFMSEYEEAKRTVEEQELLLDEKDKERIRSMLQRNALPEHMYYKYDFFFDNCATRIRDIYRDALGKNFVYGNVLHTTERLTFRDIINRYFYSKHWERVGVNILLGSKIDSVMSNADIMFLPDFLRDGLAGAKLDGKPAAKPVEVLYKGAGRQQAGPNLPLLLTCTLLLLTIAGLFVPKLRLLGRFMSALLLFVSGLLGCIILGMWFATDHQGCSDNWNILWALPINIIVAFAKPRGKGKYAVIAMALIVVMLLLHVLHVQGLVIEFLPFLASLFLVHWAIYRNSKNLSPLPVTTAVADNAVSESELV